MKVTWAVDNVVISEISERERIEEKTGERLSYRVVKFRQDKKDKRSCLCFREKLSQTLGIGLCCNLRGEVSFASGSTYLMLSHLESEQNQVSVESQ